MIIRIVFLIIIFPYILLSNQNELIIKKGTDFKIIAAEGIDDKILGMGFTQDFFEMNKQVYSGSKSTTKEATYQSSYYQIENYMELDAYAKVFSIMKGGVNSKSENRYAVLTIYFIEKTISFQPKGSQLIEADFYASKIHYGWSLNYIISSNSSIFTREVSANLQKLIGIGVASDFKLLTTSMNLNQDLKLKGLSGTSHGVTIALKPEETLNQFKKSKNSVPILIEYKALKDISSQSIDWNSPNFTEGEYTLEGLKYKISNRKSDGKNWDAGLGNSTLPDVICKIYLNGIEINSSSKETDKTESNLKLNKKITLRSGDIIQLVFIDIDMMENDKIGSASITFDELQKYRVDNNGVKLTTQSQLQECVLYFKKN